MTTYVTTLTIDSDSATFEIGSTVIIEPIPTSSDNSPTTAYIASSSSSLRTISTAAKSTTFTTFTTSITSAIPAATSPASSNGSSGPSAGQIVGIVLGSVIGGCLLICLIFFFFCWKRRSRRQSGDDSHVGEKPSSRASMRRSFRVLGTHRSSHPKAAEKGQGAASGGVNHPETRTFALAVNPSPLGKPNRWKSKKRAVLPISAPIPANRVSIRGSLHERFFSEPPSVPRSTSVANQHISDTTTIRTSANPPTPITPPITILPTYSATQSQSTSFEEDQEQQVEATPPVSASTAVETPVQPDNTKIEQNRLTGNNIEAGIKRSISRAMAHIPMTARYDVGNHGIASRSSAAHPSLISKNGSTLRRHISTSLKPGAASSGDASSRQIDTLLNQHSSSPPYLEIPDRESSLRDFGAETRRELALPSRSQITLQSESPGILRPPPLALRKYSKRSHSSIRTFTSRTVSKSASAETLRLTMPAANSQLRRSRTRHEKISIEDIARYASKPLPAVGKSDTTFGTNSGSTLAVRETPAPSRLRLPSINQEPLEIFAPTHYVPPEAIFTPDRTSTGELILRVDL